MKKEDLGALKNLYGEMYNGSLTESENTKPTVTKTINTGLGIYESIQALENEKSKEVITEEVKKEEVVIVESSTPSTTPMKNHTAMLGESSWGTASKVKDIAGLYSSIYEAKGEKEEKKDCVKADKKTMHNCAKKVCSEQWGVGECIYGQHAVPDAEGHVAWYDVMFEHGIEKGVDISTLEVLEEGSHNEHVEHSAELTEKKELDKDGDGDKDFADVMIARMIASGMSKEEAMAKVKNKEYDLKDGKKEEVKEATAMAKRGYDEAPIRRKIAAKTGGGKSADRATALAGKETYGRKGVDSKAREGLARKQRTDFRKTTSSSPGLHGYGHKSNDPAVKEKQAARGAQRGVLTPNEKKSLNREDFSMSDDNQLYEVVASYLLENNFAEDIDSANAIMENMSSAWVVQIVEDYNEYVEDFNVFVENVELAGYDLDEFTDEELEEAYKSVDKKKAVERAANKEKAAKNIDKYTKYRAKGMESANRMRGALTGGRKADRPAPKADKSKDAPGGYDPEKLNKDWQSRSTPDSKLKRRTAKGMETETVSQRMDREHPYKNRMTGKMGREYGSRAAANVTDVMRQLKGNKKKED